MEVNQKPLIVSRVPASHPKAVEFNKELEALRVRRETLVAYLKARADEVYCSMQKAYAYEVKDASREPYLPADVREQRPIRLVRKWINKKDFTEVCKRYGVAVEGADQDPIVCSVVYFRKNGMILNIPGSGASLLKVNRECSDEEWTCIMEGVVFGGIKSAA